MICGSLVPYVAFHSKSLLPVSLGNLNQGHIAMTCMYVPGYMRRAQNSVSFDNRMKSAQNLTHPK